MEDKRYIVTGGRTLEEISAYLYESVCKIVITLPTVKGRLVAIVEAEDDYWAEIQSGRLSSGLMGGRVHETYDAASAQMHELASLGSI